MAVSNNKMQEKNVANKPARMMNPFEDFDRMLDGYFSRGARGLLSPFGRDLSAWPTDVPQPFEGRVPKVDVIDRDGEVLLKAELPGVKKEDLEVTIKNNKVSIKASTHHEDKEEKGDYYHCEISRGEFSRIVQMPTDIDAESAKAKFQDGILELTMPKMERSRKQKVEIE